MSTASIPTTHLACQIASQGPLEVIPSALSSIPVPRAGPGEVLYKVEYAGVNFIDTYQRGGVYVLPMPHVLGNESAGVVVEVGEGVQGLAVGDRVAAYTPGGSFAEYCVNNASKTVKLPDGLSTRDAAAGLLQGLTAVTLTKEAHEVKRGEHILVQAAAGGLGLLLVQLCKSLGAIVIGTTSTPAKAALAKAAGADHVILYSDPAVDVVEEVFKITGGEGIDRGVEAVFDGVGKDTFEMDFQLLKRKGTLVTLGNASGPCPPFAPLKLGPKNLKICRPVLTQYVYTAAEFKHYADMLFGYLKDGTLKLEVFKEYEFTGEGIRQSQVDIMGRGTSGKLLIKIGA